MEAYILTEGEDIKRVTLNDDGIGDLYTDLPDDFMSTSHLYKLINGTIKKVLNEDGESIVPKSITKLQASRYLRAIGRYQELMTLLDSDPTGNARADWNDSSDFERHDDMILAMGVAFGYDDDGIDNFFINASKLNQSTDNG